MIQVERVILKLIGYGEEGSYNNIVAKYHSQGTAWWPITATHHSQGTAVASAALPLTHRLQGQHHLQGVLPLQVVCSEVFPRRY